MNDNWDDSGAVQWLYTKLARAVEGGATVAEAVQQVDTHLAAAKRTAFKDLLGQLGRWQAVACPPTIPCACGASTLRLAGRQRKRSVEFEFGQVSFRRPYYSPTRQHRCGCPGRHPLDERLDLPRGLLSKAIAKSLCLLAVIVPFERATDLMQRLCGIFVSKKRAVVTVSKVAAEAYRQHRQRAARRWEQREQMIASRPKLNQRKGRLFVMVDGTSVGIRNSEEFKECKSAVLFWEHDLKPRRPRRKKKRGRTPQQITRRLIVSHIGSHLDFRPFLWDAFVEMGGLGAESVIWVGDGIDWIWSAREELLGEDFRTHELLDWYHLFENVWKAARVLFDDPVEQRRWVNTVKRQMRRRNTGRVLSADLRQLAMDPARTPDQQEVIERVASYVEGHQYRMPYADFRYNGWPRGSAAIESIQHSVIQGRFKLPGMRWTVEGANRMLRLRNAYFSGQWDQIFDEAFASYSHQPVRNEDDDCLKKAS